MFVGVFVLVGVLVGVRVGVAVGVSVGVLVFVGVAVGVRVGGLVDLSCEALQTGYLIVCQGTPLAGSSLQIEHIPISAHCRSCGKETEIDKHFYICSHCLSADVEISSGLELDLAWIDLDDTPAFAERESAPAGKEHT